MNEIVPAAQADRALYDAAPSMAAMSPMTMLQTAIERGASMEIVERLTALYERWMKFEAEKAFEVAIAAAKADIPIIRKNKHVGFVSNRTNSSTDYDHEDMAEIARTVTPILTKHGLSYRFRTSSTPGQPVVVTCILAHKLGHREETTLDAERDSSGNKNSIQAVGSTVTFLQRYTLKAALGLAAAKDDDARSANAETIGSDQINELEKLITDIGGEKAPALKKGFLKKFNIEAVWDLPATEMKNAIDALNAKRTA